MFRQRDVRERETFARCRSIESIGTYSSRSEPADDGSFAPRDVAGMRVQYIVFRSVGANIELFRQLFENKQKNRARKIALLPLQTETRALINVLMALVDAHALTQ